MHWFWRATLSIVIGTTLSCVLYASFFGPGPLFRFYGLVYRVLGGQSGQFNRRAAIACVLTYSSPGIVVAVFCFALLTRQRASVRFDPEEATARPILSFLCGMLAAGVTLGSMVGCITFFSARRQSQDALYGIVGGVFMGALSGVPALWAYSRLRGRPVSPSPPETHCRRCGYILRGISEPRCPECGERI